MKEKLKPKILFNYLTILIVLGSIASTIFAFPKNVTAQISPQSPCNLTAQTPGLQATVEADRDSIKWDTEFSVYIDQSIPQQYWDSCEQKKNGYSFRLWAYNLNTVGYSIGEFSVPGKFATFYKENGKAGFHVRFDNISIQDLGKTEQEFYNTGFDKVYLYGYFYERTQSGSTFGTDNIEPPKILTRLRATDAEPPAIRQLPPVVDGGGVTQNNTVRYSNITLRTGITDKVNFYRVSRDGYIVRKQQDGTNKVLPLNDNGNNSAGKIGLYLGLDSPNELIWSSGNPNLITDASENFLPTYQRLARYSQPLTGLQTLAMSETTAKNEDICGPVLTATRYKACYGDSIEVLNSVIGEERIDKTKQIDYQLVISQSTLSKWSVTNASATGTVYQIYVYPNLKFDPSYFTLITNPGAYFARAYGIAFTDKAQIIYIQYYETQAQLEANKDAAPPSGVKPYEEVTSTATQNNSTLYDFIKKAISYILIIIVQAIYYIFAYLIAPFIKALLHIHPYQDSFVNVIYPGWLILRNLANIAFILALLMIGLLTLFQRQTASQSQSLIIRLVLMALLVNFSLVIAQGIVAIADTVQSQFLPDDSNVIEALGNQLMVVPLQKFAAESNTGTLTTSTEFANLIRPLILVLFAIGSVTTFIAVAGFLAVRLVALWILYMTSPIAYVGRILPQTQDWAKRWWKDFLKYVMITPVLAFFLNIAALFAAGSFVQTIPLNTDDGLAESAVNFGLTLVQHVFVIGFLLFGLKMAASSGTYGANGLTDFAAKGINKPLEWARRGGRAAGRGAAGVAGAVPVAKDFVGDKFATALQNKGFNKLAGATQAVFKPTAAAKAVKKGFWDIPGEERKGREAKRLREIQDQSNLIANNKWKALKYATSTAVGAGPKQQFDTGSKLLDEAKILMDTDRKRVENNLATETTKLAAKKDELKNVDTGKMSVGKAQKMMTDIDKEILSLQNKSHQLQKQQTKQANTGNTAGAQITQAELSEVSKRLSDLANVKTQLNNGVNSAQNGEVDTAAVEQALKKAANISLDVVFKPEDYKAELEKEIKEIENEHDRLDKQIKEDDRRRTDHGYGDFNTANHGQMNPQKKADLEQDGAEIQKKASERFLPLSYGARESRRSAEREQEKKWEDIDDVDELTNAFGKAIKNNNDAFATAIAKKMAKEGTLHELMAKEGFENNVKSFQSFLEKKLGNMQPQVRFQVASEISNIAAQNGNSAIAKSVKVDSSGVMRWSTQDEQSAAVDPKIEAKAPGDLAKLKKNEISYQEDGQVRLRKGLVKNLNSMNQDKLKTFVDRSSASYLNYILKAENAGSLNSEVVRMIQKK